MSHLRPTGRSKGRLSLSCLSSFRGPHDRVAVTTDDHVLVHGDLGSHNIAVDPETSEVREVFDYDGASWADRHYDFRYLLFDHQQDHALEASLEVYEPVVGRALAYKCPWQSPDAS